MPKATMARLSPTRIISMPAASATWALGKSWAVIMVMGSFFWWSVRRVFIVTFFLGFVFGVPMGKCELFLVWCCSGDGNMRGAIGRHGAVTLTAERIKREIDCAIAFGRGVLEVS
jgi:hypothetical protein